MPAAILDRNLACAATIPLTRFAASPLTTLSHKERGEGGACATRNGSPVKCMHANKKAGANAGFRCL
jgi:hypothetical protein